MEINGLEIDEYNIHGIREKSTSSTCPSCSHTRTKKNDKCMSVFWDTGLGKCNHCGELIQLHTYKKKIDLKVYIKPLKKAASNTYSERLKSYFNSRSISVKCMEAFKIREAKEWMPQTKKEENCICFDYFYKSELINTKFRDGAKNFKLVKDAEKILFNLDSLKGHKTALIVEGEFDAMAWWEAGITNVVSVPNGFNLKGNTNLDYLDNYMDLFIDKEIIYLAVDKDEAGDKGREELIRRFGYEKSRLVDFLDCKDSNEFLVKNGPEELKGLLAKAVKPRIKDVYNAGDIRDKLMFRFRNGQKRGTTTYFEEFDKVWTWREGEVTAWTGYQNEGKSALLNQLCLLRALNEGAKVAFFSPENTPLEDFFNELIESFIGKSADIYYKHNLMEEWEYEYAINVIQNYFFMIYPEKDFTIDMIFEKTRALVRSHGIRTLVIDPYNTIEHMMKPGEREDLYISRFHQQLKMFAVQEDVSIQIVYHQNTAVKNKEDEGRYYKPDLNKIKGGGTVADKCDNVNIVWRPNRAINFKDTEVIFGSQKIKKQKLVGVPGEVLGIDFDRKTQRYFLNGKSPFESFDLIRKPPLGHIEKPKSQWPLGNFYESAKETEITPDTEVTPMF